MRIRAGLFVVSCLMSASAFAQTQTVTLEPSAYGALEWKYAEPVTSAWTAPKFCGRTAAGTMTDCTITLRTGTVVNVHVRPMSPHRFFRWGGICGANAPNWVATDGDLCDITMNGSGSVRAEIESFSPVARPLKPGDIVLLRNSNGYLTADKSGERLFLSGTPSAASQWELRDHNFLTSFWGSTLFVGDTSAAPVHTASVSVDMVNNLTAVYMNPPASPPGWMTMPALGVTNNDSVAYFTGRYSFLAANNTAVIGAMGASVARLPNGARWQILLANPVAPNRLPLQTAMRSGNDFYVRSMHNTFFTFDSLPNNPKAQDGVLPGPAVHSAQINPFSNLSFRGPDFPGTGQPLRFGDNVMFQWTYGLKYGNIPVGLVPDDAKNAVMIVPYDTSKRWTLTDASGLYQQGNRIPIGAKFCLRSASGKFISADPTKRSLSLAPHCSGWETWTAQSKAP